MIIANHKPIKIIGYKDSAMTMEFYNEIFQTHQTADIITPEEFACLQDPYRYQYIVAVSKLTNRKKTIEMVDQASVDLVTVIHDTAILGKFQPPRIGAGTFIFNHTTVCLGSEIGRHCIVDPYSMIGHFCKIGNNCQIRPNVMINGKSSIGNNCMVNTGVTVTNNSKITDDVELLAFTKVIKDINHSGIYLGPSARKFNNVKSPNEL